MLTRTIFRAICATLILSLILPVADAQRRSGRSRSSQRRPPVRVQPTNPNNAPPPVITVTKTDNSLVRGTLMSATTDEIFIQPAPKAGERAPAQPDPDDFVAIEWKDILRVSNGLTRQKVLDEWKQEHRNELCRTCGGDQLVFCPVCKGTGHDPKSGADCEKCKGALVIDCTNAKCTDGKIPCPNSCLRLTEGTWYTKPDGTKWRKFPVGNGFREWSEHHVGEVVVRQGNDWVNKGKCPVCGGTTEINCPNCHGTDKIPCPTCVARKDAAVCPNEDCDRGMVECPTCKGTGLRTGGPTTPVSSLLYDIEPQG